MILPFVMYGPYLSMPTHHAWARSSHAQPLECRALEGWQPGAHLRWAGQCSLWQQGKQGVDRDGEKHVASNTANVNEEASSGGEKKAVRLGAVG